MRKAKVWPVPNNPPKMNSEELAEWEWNLEYNKRIQEFYCGYKKVEYLWPDGLTYYIMKKVMNTKGLWRQHVKNQKSAERKAIRKKRKEEEKAQKVLKNVL